jgi:hypothetical protein
MFSFQKKTTQFDLSAINVDCILKFLSALKDSVAINPPISAGSGIRRSSIVEEVKEDEVFAESQEAALPRKVNQRCKQAQRRRRYSERLMNNMILSSESSAPGTHSASRSATLR